MLGAGAPPTRIMAAISHSGHVPVMECPLQHAALGSGKGRLIARRWRTTSKASLARGFLRTAG
jgi:hypothetical protein